MKHKIIPMILCLLLCMAFTPAAAFADNAKTAPDGIWTDYAAANFAEGSGTKDDPYQIATPEQLAKLAADINSGVGDKTHSKEHFKLTADLDLSAHRWIPIGTGPGANSFHSFSGYFDGNGKTISGLYVDESQYSAGLFGHFSGYEIKNLTIKDGYVKTGSGDRDGAGILIGSATEGYGMSISVENCSVSGTVESDSVATGGLAGYNSYGSYENCTADVTINGGGKAGGFVGEEFNGKYTDCVAKGKVNGSWSVGGFVGVLFFESEIEHCASYGKVTATNWNCGGFTGYVENGVKIKECVAFSDVESKVDGFEPKAGGFAGTIDGANGGNTISNSHAAGTLTMASSDYKAGGFAAVLVGSNSFNSCSFDVEKNAGLKAIGGETSADVDGVAASSTQVVKANICSDYDYKHEGTLVEGKDATCTEDGWKAYYKCEACGSLYANDDLTEMIDNPEVIKATGHEFGEWKVTKEATATEKGEKERTCSKCQLVEKADIPATGATDPVTDDISKSDSAKDNTDKSAETGDDSNIALYGILALLAAGGAAGAVIGRRRKA